MLQFVPVKGKKEDYPVVKDVIYLDDTTGDSMTKKYDFAVRNYVKDDTWYCFRHNDLTINTPMDDVEWFLNNRIGSDVAIAGVIGTYNLEQSMHWWVPFREINGAGFIKQVVLGPDHKPVEPMRTYDMPDWPGYHEGLATVDGCILFIHKKLFDSGAKFDPKLTSYHFYDVDICLQALEHHYQVATVPIVCTHISRGEVPPDIDGLRANCFAKWNSKVHGIWPINKFTKFY
jgi:hypothetical protein